MTAFNSDGRNNELHLRSHRDCDTLTFLVVDYLSKQPGLGRTHGYPKGTFVWNQGTTDHAIHFLRRGQVLITLNDVEGCEVILRVIKPGELFGELCFCSKREEPRENSARAAIDSESLQLNYSDFVDYLRRSPLALEGFTLRLCERLADAENRIEVLSHRGAEARLGRLLLQLAKKSIVEQSKPEQPVKVAIGHDELARMAAMTRPHLTVTMGKLRTRGLIHYGRGSQLTIEIQRLKDHIDQPSSRVRERTRDQ